MVGYFINNLIVRYLITIILVLAYLYMVNWYFQKLEMIYNNNLGNIIAQVSYLCSGGKAINATYYSGTPMPTPKPGEPPSPNGVVKIALSDGRQLTLHQTLSADGTRYSNGNPSTGGSESFVFWSVGNSAFINENDKETYSGCVALAKNPGDLLGAYVDASGTFSIRYPSNYSVNPSYVYQELGPGKDINGVKFTIPESMATGTNLSGFDTGVSVEKIPNAQDCNAKLFLYPEVASLNITDNGVDYSFASSTGAGAGNRYEEEVWAIPNTNPCVAVRYFIHYMAIENYPPKVVSNFNRDALLKQFDQIRQSLVLAP